MKTLPMDSITVAPRQRKTIHAKPLDDLRESIAKRGLFHPVVVRRSGRENILVIGERRLRAMRDLHNSNRLFSYDGTVVSPGEIPYIELGDLDDLQYMEAELEENILRENLTWQDRCAAIAAIHDLRTEHNETQTIKDTAKELAEKGPKKQISYQIEIQRANIIQRFMDDPDVCNARTENEAYRIARNKAVGPFFEEMSRREQDHASRECPHTLHFGDCRKIDLPDGHFDLILADPPYGIGANKFGDAAEQRHTYSDDASAALELADWIITRGHTLTTARGKLILFCDIELFLRLRETAKNVGWNVWRTPLVWRKGSTAHAPLGPDGFRREYELMLFAWKGQHPLNALRSDIFDIPTTKEREHAAQKPLALYTELIRITCRPGDYIIDPCCGSGTIFPAAFATVTRAVGIEIDKNTHVVAQQRLMDTT